MPVFGAGTVTFGTGTPKEINFEVTGGSITHAYDDVERKATLADTVKPSARKVPAGDTLKLELVNDLSTAGYYSYAFANELTEITVDYTPNTADGATWDGTVVILKPDEIGASEWGADIESSLELPFVGPVNFTESTVIP